MEYDAEGLHQVARPRTPTPVADIVFVHGLGGGAHSTWQHGKPDSPSSFFWPAELGKDLPTCTIWTVGYPAGLTGMGKPGTVIEKRAGNLSQKLSNAGLGSRPIIFITHSMGGLVVKCLVVDSQTHADPDRKRIASMTNGIVFCATPHSGSFFADAATVLGRFLGGVQDHVSEMKANAEPLDFLHDKFIEWQRRNSIPVQSYAESIGLLRTRRFLRPLPLGLVVLRSSANPGIAGHTVHDVDDDHLTIVKPRDRKHDVYAGVLRFIREILSRVGLPIAIAPSVAEGVGVTIDPSNGSQRRAESTENSIASTAFAADAAAVAQSDALEEAVNRHPVTPTPGDPTDIASREARKALLPRLVALVVIALLGLSGIWYFVFRHHQNETIDPAQNATDFSSAVGIRRIKFSKDEVTLKGFSLVGAWSGGNMGSYFGEGTGAGDRVGSADTSTDRGEWRSVALANDAWLPPAQVLVDAPNGSLVSRFGFDYRRDENSGTSESSVAFGIGVLGGEVLEGRSYSVDRGLLLLRIDAIQGERGRSRISAGVDGHVSVAGTSDDTWLPPLDIGASREFDATLWHRIEVEFHPASGSFNVLVSGEPMFRGGTPTIGFPGRVPESEPLKVGAMKFLVRGVQRIDNVFVRLNSSSYIGPRPGPDPSPQLPTRMVTRERVNAALLKSISEAIEQQYHIDVNRENRQYTSGKLHASGRRVTVAERGDLCIWSVTYDGYIDLNGDIDHVGDKFTGRSPPNGTSPLVISGETDAIPASRVVSIEFRDFPFPARNPNPDPFRRASVIDHLSGLIRKRLEAELGSADQELAKPDDGANSVAGVVQDVLIGIPWASQLRVVSVEMVPPDSTLNTVRQLRIKLDGVQARGREDELARLLMDKSQAIGLYKLQGATFLR